MGVNKNYITVQLPDGLQKDAWVMMYNSTKENNLICKMIGQGMEHLQTGFTSPPNLSPFPHPQH